MSERGSLENPDHIDDGYIDEDANAFVLAIHYSGDWKPLKLTRKQLEEKLHAYSAFVREGFLEKMRPEAANYAIEVHLHSERGTPKEIINDLERMKRNLRPHIADLRVIE